MKSSFDFYLGIKMFTLDRLSVPGLKFFKTVRLVLLMVLSMNAITSYSQFSDRPCIIQLINGKNIKSKQSIARFLDDSVVTNVRFNDTLLFSELAISISQISSITLSSKRSVSIGVLKGFVKSTSANILLDILGELAFQNAPFFSPSHVILPLAKVTIPISSVLGGILKGRQHKKFRINGSREIYQSQIENMKSFLIQ